MSTATIGLDRKIRLAWLDGVLDGLLIGEEPEQLRTRADTQLAQELGGQASRAKCVGQVLRIWVNVHAGHRPHRDRGVALAAQVGQAERLALHWGMTLLAYPFFRDVVEAIGRLLALQSDFTAAQIRSRLVNTWGERTTIGLAGQSILSSLVDWGVLRSGRRGSFIFAGQVVQTAPATELWLLDAVLRGQSGGEVEIQQLLRSPALFPFRISVGLREIREHNRFEVHRQGIDMDMIALKEEPALPRQRPPKAELPPPLAPAAVAQVLSVPDPLLTNGHPTDLPPAVVPAPVPAVEEAGPALSRREMVRRYHEQTGGFLLEQFPLVPAVAEGGEQQVDGLILPDLPADTNIAETGLLRGRHIVLVEAEAGRLTRDLLGRAVFAAALARQHEPRTIRVVALCRQDDARLRALVALFPQVEVVVLGTDPFVLGEVVSQHEQPVLVLDRSE